MSSEAEIDGDAAGERERWMAYCRTRDARLRSALIEEQMSWVRSFAAHHYRVRNWSIDDLTQQGMIGVMEFMDKFDPYRLPYVRFRTAATPYVRGAISPAIKQDIADYPTLHEIKVPEWLTGADEIEPWTDSFTAYKASDRRIVLSQLPDNVPGRDPGVEETVMASLDGASLSQTLEEAMATLSARQRRVIELRFGLTPDGEPWSQREIGETFSPIVTQQRISAIQAAALVKLRAALSQTPDGVLILNRFDEQAVDARKRAKRPHVA